MSIAYVLDLVADAQRRWAHLGEITSDRLVETLYAREDNDVLEVFARSGVSVDALRRSAELDFGSLAGVDGPQLDRDAERRAAAAVGLMHGSGVHVSPSLAILVAWVFLPWPMEGRHFENLKIDRDLFRQAISERCGGDLGLADITPKRWSKWNAGDPPVDPLAVRSGRTADGRILWAQQIDS
jgi:hypothetical protein